MDLRKFSQRYEFDFESATLGRLHCRGISLSAVNAVKKILADTNLTGRAFVVKLLQQIAEHVPEAAKEASESEQDSTPVTAEEADRLTDDEIESLTEEFLTHNPFLVETFERTAREGRIPEENEKKSDYLLRVMRHYSDELTRRLKELTGLFPFSKGLNLPKSTLDILRENLFLSDRLRGLTRLSDKVRQLTRVADTGIAPSSEMLHLARIPENPIHETNRRLNAVLDRMDDMRPYVAESADLIRSSNDASVAMLAQAHKTTSYTLVMIVIATLSLIVTAGFEVANYVSRNTATAQTRELIEQFDAQIQSLSETQGQRTERLITAFQESLSKQRAEDRRLFLDALRRNNNHSENKAQPQKQQSRN